VVFAAIVLLYLSASALIYLMLFRRAPVVDERPTGQIIDMPAVEEERKAA